MTGLKQDWPRIASELDEQGWATLPGLMDDAGCDRIAGLYDRDGAFRSRMVMARHGVSVKANIAISPIPCPA